MPIPVVCTGCQSRLNAPDHAAGKQVRCPKCQAAVGVPVPMVAEAVETVEAKPVAPVATPAAPVQPARTTGGFDFNAAAASASPRTRAAEPDRPRPAARSDRDEEEDDRPRRKRRPAYADDDNDDDDNDRPRRRSQRPSGGSGIGVVIALGFVVLLMIGGGGFAVYWFGLRGKEKDDGAGGGGGGATAEKAVVPGGWKSFSPPKSGFKVSMPQVPPNASVPVPVPPPGTKVTPAANYSTGSNEKLYCVVRVYAFSSGMDTAERERTLLDKVNASPPKEVAREISSKKTTLGGREATELVREVDVTAARNKFPNFGNNNGQKPPAKIVGVARYCLAGNRGYIAEIVAHDGRPSAADEKTFFDSFEITPVADPELPTPTPPPNPTPNPSPTPPPAVGDGWSTLQSGTVFRARFPGPSKTDTAREQEVQKLGATGRFAEHTDPASGVTCRVGYFKTAGDAAKRKQDLDAVVSSIVGNSTPMPGKPRKVGMAGRVWDETTFTRPNGTGTTVVRTLDTGRSVFVASVGGDTVPAPSDIRAKFFAAFQIVE